jgi:two-component system NtrC family sensor kinase
VTGVQTCALPIWLSVGYNIIKAHRGTIDVESEVDHGTTFRIILPVEGALPESAKEAHASQDPGR